MLHLATVAEGPARQAPENQRPLLLPRAVTAAAGTSRLHSAPLHQLPPPRRRSSCAERHPSAVRGSRRTVAALPRRGFFAASAWDSLDPACTYAAWCRRSPDSAPPVVHAAPGGCRNSGDYFGFSPCSALTRGDTNL